MPIIAHTEPLASLEATADLGKRLAPLLRPGDVLALDGVLGAGKTTLARAIIRAHYGAGLAVPSPTYALVQIYQGQALSLWHVDLYRLRSAGELAELGLEDAETAALLVEWPEKLGALLPSERLDIVFDLTASPRLARFAAHGGWAARLGW